MHYQADQNKFENLDENQIMQEDDLDYRSVRDRYRSLRERNKEERQ